MHLLHDYHPQVYGGTENYVAALTKVQKSMKLKPLIVCARDAARSGPSILVPESINEIPVWGVHRTGPKLRSGLKRFVRSFYDPQVDALILKLIAEQNVDIIHVHHSAHLSLGFMDQALAQGVPVVATLHDYWFLCHRCTLFTPREGICIAPRTGLQCAKCFALDSASVKAACQTVTRAPAFHYRQRMLAKWLNTFRYVLIPSRFMRKLIAPAGVPAARTVDVAYGIVQALDLEIPYPLKEKLTIGYVGAVKLHKGLHYLIHALNRVPNLDLQLEIWGDHSVDQAYTRRLNELADSRIIFKGGFAPEAAATIMRRFDLLVVPSLWLETGPLVVLEAMQVGIPVVGFSVGGICELVTGDTMGRLVQLGDTAQLAEAISALGGVRQGRQVRRDTSKFAWSIESNVEAVERIYESALGTR